MPELPEVERARRLVHDLCLGSTMTSVHRPVLDDKVFVDVDVGAFESALAKRKIIASERHGKQLWWTLDGEDAKVPCFHFGMTGAFVVRGLDGIQYYNSKATGAGDWPPRFAKATFAFDNGIELAYVDPRRFGKIKLVRDVKEVIGGLGVDPSKALPEGDAFAAMWKRRSAPIKTALMDQKIMAGIGNWMADEILYRARVHPETRANEMTDSQLEAIRERILEVVTVACAANSDHDLFPSDWLFHQRWGKTDGAKVNGDAIKFIEVGGRTTAYVPKLQLKTDRAITIKREIKREPEAEHTTDPPKPKRARAAAKRASSAKASPAAPAARVTRASARAIA